MIKQVIIAIFTIYSVLVYGEDGLYTNALGLFDPVSTDVSLNYLRMLFGTVGNALVAADTPAGNIIGSLFNIFNTGMVIFAGGFISYTIFRSAITTAEDGGAAVRQGKSHAWSSFRILLGVTLLAPMYQGYSMAQVTVMWSAISGIGLADNIWERTVDHIAKTGGGLLSSVASDNYKDSKVIAINNRSTGDWNLADINKVASLNDLMASATCLAIMENTTTGLLNKNSSNTSFEATSVESQIRTGLDCGVNNLENIICFGFKDNPTLCGAYTWDNINNSDAQNVVAGLITKVAFSYYQSMLNTYDAVSLFLDKYSAGDNSIDFSNLLLARKALIEDTSVAFSCKINQKLMRTDNVGLCNPGGSLITDSVGYNTAVAQFRSQVNDKNNLTEAAENWAKISKRDGWIVAGGAYYMFATTSDISTDDIESIDNYQFQVYKPITDNIKDMINSTQSYIDCFSKVGNSNKPSLQFDNLGDVIAKVNGSLSSGGSISVAATSKDYTAACIMTRMLADYARYAFFGISKIEQEQIDKTTIVGETQGITLNRLNSLTAGALNTLFDSNTIIAVNDKDKGGFMDSSKLLKTIYLNVPQDNINVMLLNVYSKLLGFNAFNELELANTFSDGSLNTIGKKFDIESRYNTSCVQAKDHCAKNQTNNTTVQSTALGCFEYALQNGCINKSEGVLGSMASSFEGVRVDQIQLLSNLGLTMLNSAILYWTKTTQGVYVVIKAVATDYMTTMGIAASAGSLGAAGVEAAAAWAKSGFVLGKAAEITSALVKGGATLYINFLATIDYKFVVTSLGVYLPFGVTLAAIFFGLGTTLGLYLPIIPFITFLFGAIGWLIMLVEAMVAAPLIALEITHPNGHDLLGKSEQAVILLLGIFLRPVAMILGFTLAVVLVYIAMELFNIGFLSVIVNYLDSSIDGQKAIVLAGFCGFLLVYTYIALALINQCFTLIYQVPDKLLRWIGGAPASNSVSQIMQEIKGGVRDSSSQAGQAATQSAAKVPKVSPSMQDVTIDRDNEKEKPTGHYVQNNNDDNH